ncbi:MAG: accessory gene regulator B family protein [Firmicutes bacterium]|nr:accessory gene regulator B family protein [Bacillota bacterium]
MTKLQAEIAAMVDPERSEFDKCRIIVRRRVKRIAFRNAAISYVIVFSFLAGLAFVTRNPLGIMIMVGSFFALRYTYQNKVTYHCDKHWQCMIATCVVFTLGGILVTQIHLGISILFGPVLMLGLTWVLHKMGVGEENSEKLDKLTKKYIKRGQEITELKAKNEELQTESQVQEQEVVALRARNQMQGQEVEQLRAINQEKEQEVDWLRVVGEVRGREVLALRERGDEQEQMVEELRAKNEDLELRVRGIGKQLTIGELYCLTEEQLEEYGKRRGLGDIERDLAYCEFHLKLRMRDMVKEMNFSRSHIDRLRDNMCKKLEIMKPNAKKNRGIEQLKMA